MYLFQHKIDKKVHNVPIRLRRILYHIQAFRWVGSISGLPIVFRPSASWNICSLLSWRSLMACYIYLTGLRPPHLLLRVSVANPYFPESIWIKNQMFGQGNKSKFVSISIMTVLSLFPDWGRMGRLRVYPWPGSTFLLSKPVMCLSGVFVVFLLSPHFSLYLFLSIFLSLVHGGVCFSMDF